MISELQTTTLHDVTQLLDREREQDEFTLSTQRLLGTYDRVKYQFEKAFPYESLEADIRSHVSSLRLQDLSLPSNCNSKNKTKQKNKTSNEVSDIDVNWKSEQAITVMAQCVSYYDLSYRRFVDNVSMSINSALIKKFSKRIEAAMFKSINILNGSTQELCRLLQEDPTITQRRNQIQSRTQQLSLFIDELTELIPDNTGESDMENLDSNPTVTSNNTNDSKNGQNGSNSNQSGSSQNTHKPNEAGSNKENSVVQSPTVANVASKDENKNSTKDVNCEEEDRFEDARKALKAHDRNVPNSDAKKFKHSKTKRKKRRWKLFG